jgi:hypothetical protein
MSHLQLSSMLLQNRHSQVQAYFMKTTAGALNVIPVLDDKPEIIRNDMYFRCPYVPPVLSRQGAQAGLPWLNVGHNFSH